MLQHGIAAFPSFVSLDHSVVALVVTVSARAVIRGSEYGSPPIAIAMSSPSPSSLLTLDNHGQIAAFEASYPKLRDHFLSHVRTQYQFPDTAIQRLHRMFDYNILGGKYYRACLVTSTIQSICQSKGLPIDKYWESALQLGWAIEVLQAMFLVADDMMDKSLTRRGKPCWYLQPDVQGDAINDTLILESFLYQIIHDNFAAHPEYVNIFRLFQEVSLATQMGQMLDLTSQPLGRRDVEILRAFNYSLYEKIVTYKTALYTFYLPLASGLLITGFHSPQDLNTVKEISIQLGIKFQIQDDYLDCFGAPEVIGKIGTDIKDHKCSWLVVQALQLVTNDSAARTVLEDNYGYNDNEKEARIKQLYQSLRLEALFEQQEEDSLAKIQSMIHDHQENLPPSMFMPILNKIHKRQK